VQLNVLNLARSLYTDGRKPKSRIGLGQEDMAKLTGTWQPHLNTSEDDSVTTAEDAALVLALVVIVILSGTLVTFLLLEFLDVLPVRVGSILLATLFIFCGVVGRAILSRALSMPPSYQGNAPVIRNIGRRHRRRSTSIHPVRA
jgi:hypothetical protein